MKKENFKWEKDFTHTWNVLKLYDPRNNSTLNLDQNKGTRDVSGIASKLSNRVDIKSKVNYNFNYFRNLILIVDFSENILSNNIKPNRKTFIISRLEEFIREFFEINFLSNITVIGLCKYTAYIIHTFSNEPESIIESLKTNQKIGGFTSLYNALNVVIEYCSNYLSNSTAIDILLVYNSVNTIDRGNILESLEKLIAYKVEINCITFENSFKLLKKLSKLTGGVLLQYQHENDFTSFLSFINTKRSIPKEKLIVRFSLAEQYISQAGITCDCHYKQVKIYYLCKNCNSVYCTVPYICTFCIESYIYVIIENTHLSHLLKYNEGIHEDTFLEPSLKFYSYNKIFSMVKFNIHSLESLEEIHKKTRIFPSNYRK